MYANPVDIGLIDTGGKGFNESNREKSVDSVFQNPHKMVMETQGPRNWQYTNHHTNLGFTKSTFCIPAEERETTQYTGLFRNQGQRNPANVQHLTDKPKVTHRQTRQNSRDGNNGNVTLAQGLVPGGYTVAQDNTFIKTTHRETCSDKKKFYTGGLKQTTGTQQSRQSYENAESNLSRVASLRAYTPNPARQVYSNGGAQTHATTNNKLGNDENVHPLIPYPAYTQILTADKYGQRTSLTRGDILPEANQYLFFDLAINQLASNPFSQHI